MLIVIIFKFAYRVCRINFQDVCIPDKTNSLDVE